MSPCSSDCRFPLRGFFTQSLLLPDRSLLAVCCLLAESFSLIRRNLLTPRKKRHGCPRTERICVPAQPSHKKGFVCCCPFSGQGWSFLPTSHASYSHEDGLLHRLSASSRLVSHGGLRLPPRSRHRIRVDQRRFRQRHQEQRCS